MPGNTRKGIDPWSCPRSMARQRTTSGCKDARVTLVSSLSDFPLSTSPCTNWANCVLSFWTLARKRPASIANLRENLKKWSFLWASTAGPRGPCVNGGGARVSASGHHRVSPEGVSHNLQHRCNTAHVTITSGEIVVNEPLPSLLPCCRINGGVPLQYTKQTVLIRLSHLDQSLVVILRNWPP